MVSNPRSFCGDCHQYYDFYNDSNLCPHNRKEAVKSEGKKDDAGKPRWSLVPAWPMEQVVKVLTFGAEKYGSENYLLVENGEERYYDAAMRHLSAWRIGDTEDDDTGVSHLAHAICCLLMLLARE